MVKGRRPRRRGAAIVVLVAGMAAACTLPGCAGPPPAAHTAAGSASPPAFATPWRTLLGGFLAPVAPALGLQARPGTGMYVKLVAPAALALRGPELLVADLASGRLWRADTAFNTLTPVAGAPVAPNIALLLGADQSAWVLDPASRQVLRFARDGRLLQTWRTGPAAPSPSALALADGGLTLLVADGSLGQWAELRSGGALALPVRLQLGDGAPASVDGIASGREQLFVLDHLAGAVHRVRRDGRVVETMGRGVLVQPTALAVDRYERVFVLDDAGQRVTVLRSGAEPRVLTAAELGVQQIGGIAVDERQLAVSDRLAGQVQILTLAAEPNRPTPRHPQSGEPASMPAGTKGPSQ